MRINENTTYRPVAYILEAMPLLSLFLFITLIQGLFFHALRKNLPFWVFFTPFQTQQLRLDKTKPKTPRL